MDCRCNISPANGLSIDCLGAPGDGIESLQAPSDWFVMTATHAQVIRLRYVQGGIYLCRD